MEKVCIVCGSPRFGNSRKLSVALCDLLKKVGKSAEVLMLLDYEVKYCNGCLECEDLGACPIDDDVHEIEERLTSASIIVFATPVYFDDVPGKVKSLIDRSNAFMSKLKGRSFAVFLTGQADENSWANCSRVLSNYAEICGMNYLGAVTDHSRKSDDMTSEKLQKNLLELTKIILPECV